MLLRPSGRCQEPGTMRLKRYQARDAASISAIMSWTITDTSSAAPSSDEEEGLWPFWEDQTAMRVASRPARGSSAPSRRPCRIRRRDP